MTTATPLSKQAAVLNHPAVRQPPLKSGVVRRTSSMQVLWSVGDESRYRIVGRARDVVGKGNPAPEILGEASIEATIGKDSRIVSLIGDRRQETLAGFGGMRPGGELRKAVAHELPEEVRGETLLHRLLDDLAGASFMSTAAWYAWKDGIEGHSARIGVDSLANRPVEGVCLSYVQGSSSMSAAGQGIEDHANHPVGPLPLPIEDCTGFHALIETDQPNEWRLRRTDIWREDDELVVDAWFQDSSVIQDNIAQRVIFHEYSILATFDAATLQLGQIAVSPHVLPYVTCQAAPATAQVLVGRSAHELRDQVLLHLRGSAGCTHLNDMLRALQDITVLASSLAEQEAATGSIAD